MTGGADIVWHSEKAREEVLSDLRARLVENYEQFKDNPAFMLMWEAAGLSRKFLGRKNHE